MIQENWYYYKIIDNETGETDYYAKVAKVLGHIKPETFYKLVGMKKHHHAVEITKDEYEEE